MSQREFPNLPLVLKGAAIGMANAVPGVSGGTIAVITGIYDRTISAVSGFFSNEFGWKRNLLFLAQLAVGLLAGLFGFANLIDWLMATIPNQTQYWFIGLIIGSIPYLIKIAKVPTLKLKHWIVFVLFLAAMVIIGIQPRPEEGEPLREVSAQSLLTVFGAGIISTGTMVIPGISGSFVLLLLDLYATFIAAIKEVNLPLLAVFLLGAVLGIVLVSKVINYLLTRFHGVAYAAIIGLVLGSVVALVPLEPRGWWLLTDLAAMILGIGLALLLGSDRKDAHKNRGGDNG